MGTVPIAAPIARELAGAVAAVRAGRYIVGMAARPENLARAIVLRAVAGTPGAEAALDFSVRPHEEPVVDRLAWECGLEPGEPGYLGLRALLGLTVAFIRKVCEFSLQETIASGRPEWIWEPWVEAIDDAAKDEFALPESLISNIAATVRRYIEPILSSNYNSKMAEGDLAIAKLADTFNIPVERRAEFRNLILGFVGAANKATIPAKGEPPPLDAAAATVRAIAGLEHLQRQFNEAAASGLPQAERARLARQFVGAFERAQRRGLDLDTELVRDARRFLTGYNRRQRAAKLAASPAA